MENQCLLLMLHDDVVVLLNNVLKLLINTSFIKPRNQNLLSRCSYKHAIETSGGTKLKARTCSKARSSHTINHHIIYTLIPSFEH